MRPEDMSFDAYRIVKQLQRGGIVRYVEWGAASEVLAAGLVTIGAKGRLAITPKGSAVPRMLRRAA